MLLTNHSNNRNPIIRYRGSPITRVRKYKYLGVVLDDKLTFTEHIAYITNRGRNIFQILRKHSMAVWGVTTKSMMQIYQAAIIPIIGYASEIWIGKINIACNAKKLRSLQCLCLRTITGTYKTTPNETVCVLAKQLPIDLEIAGANAYKELRRIGSTHLLGEEILLREHRFWIAAALYVRAKLITEWQRRWDNSDKGRYCKEMISNLRDWLDITHVQPGKATQSFLSSHCGMGVHLYRTGKRTSPNCLSCDLPDSPAHRLMECPRFDEARILLEQHLNMELPPDPAKLNV
ncbi:hypothetical protein JTB14_016416 [Gonioctena quinquepunctata]|nr:hypothetical protein JTB14_016416 [Gonioctena quinquepunctata]